MTAARHPLARRLRSQDGFTMIIAIGVMFVTSMLLVAAFTVAQNDISLSHADTSQKQAYYAALAGVQEYEYKLQANPDYWQSSCETAKTTVAEEANEQYEIKVLPAEGAGACNTASPFATIVESKGTLANTFRIKSTGYAGTASRSIIATFQVTGFLNYIYVTNFETEDPSLYNAPAGCEGAYYKEWSPKGLKCQVIEFTTGDSVEGPMHTNDSTDVGGAATFGREGHNPPDKVEINGGTYPTAGCSGSAKYFTATKCYEKGQTLLPPESDTSLASYVEEANNFEGATYLTLEGSSNTIAVTNYNEKGEAIKSTIKWPENGLIYVQANGKGCGFKFESENADTASEVSQEKGCGNVYVKGSYSKSLTVAGETDVIVNGNLYPKSVEGKLGSAPTGTAVLGLIASHYVRIYHPCPGGSNGAGSLAEPYIYAALLSTAHSVLVDNPGCGAELGEIHEYGAIAQNYRGIVGRGVGSGFGHGYIKDYKYDDRLATDEPPYFLAPLKAGWKVIRETAPTRG
jgi:Tfp pilus assembly protein PilX